MEKRVSKVVSGLILISLFFTHSVFAAPPGSQYIPGETDNPSCSPGDANCNVDISSIDDQILTLSGAELIISDGNSVDLTPFTGTGTDSQSLTLSGSEIIISNGNTIDISGVFTDTDTQLNESQVDAFVTNNGYLTGETDGSVTNELQSLTLSGSEIIISNGNTIDISGVFTDTDTDDQTLSFSGNLLVISDGNSVDFSSYLDNTDSQSLTLSGSELSISNGNNVDLSGISGSSTLSGATDTNLTGSATGSLLYYDGTEWISLPIGGIGQKLVSGTGGTLSWMTDTVMTGTGATGSGTSSRIGEFIYAKSGRLVSQGYLAVTPGTVADGTINYPIWAAMYPEYISGNDIVFPSNVEGMFLRNLGGDATTEGGFQDYRTARPTTSNFTTNTAGNHRHSKSIDRATGVGGGSSGNDAVWQNDDGGGSYTAYTDYAGNHSHSITGGGDTETNPVNRAYQLYTIVDTYSAGESGTSTLSGATDTNFTSQGTGSLLYYDGSQWIDLDIGTQGQKLTIGTGNTLEWVTDSTTSVTLARGRMELNNSQTIATNIVDITMTVASNGKAVLPFNTVTKQVGGMTVTAAGFIDNNAASQIINGTNTVSSMVVPRDGEYRYTIAAPAGTSLEDDDRPIFAIAVNGTLQKVFNVHDLANSSSGDDQDKFITDIITLSAGDMVQAGYQIEGGESEAWGYRAHLESVGIDSAPVVYSYFQLEEVPTTAGVGVGGGSGDLDGLTDTNLTSQGTGSLLYYDGSQWIDLDIGTQGQALTSSGGTLVWSSDTTEDVETVVYSKQTGLSFLTTYSLDSSATWQDMINDYQYLRFNYEVDVTGVGEDVLRTITINTDDVRDDTRFRFEYGSALVDLAPGVLTGGDFQFTGSTVDEIALEIVGVKAQKTVINANDADIPTSFTDHGIWSGIDVDTLITNGVAYGNNTGTVTSTSGGTFPNGNFTGVLKITVIGSWIQQDLHDIGGGDVFFRQSFDGGATWTAWIGS